MEKQNNSLSLFRIFSGASPEPVPTDRMSVDDLKVEEVDCSDI